ncbi:MAG TPA: hypothetical protein VGD71_10080 [Kribbella sp.]|jgi:hypothetical protein
MTAPGAVSQRRIVRVWFGACVLAEYQAEASLAARYAAAMGRLFAGLDITTTPVTGSSPARSGELPGDPRLWSTTAK